MAIMTLKSSMIEYPRLSPVSPPVRECLRAFDGIRCNAITTSPCSHYVDHITDTECSSHCHQKHTALWVFSENERRTHTRTLGNPFGKWLPASRYATDRMD